MKDINIAVTGGDGQLGKSLQAWVNSNPSIGTWSFFDISDLDITNSHHLKQLFEKQSWDYLINCAAYTAVDQAEKEQDKAKAVNATAVKNMAELCENHQTKFIHISTDFVFDGTKNQPYLEEDRPNPINIYGQTKYEGEQWIPKILKEYFILRTGWLYSSYGHNFFKTMLRLSKEKKELGVIYDQIGTPTHTSVLVNVITKIILSDSKDFGLYHVTNEGVASWYDFAFEIFQQANSSCHLKPIRTWEYPTPAQRPSFSVLDKAKIKSVFQIEIPHWKVSLKDCF